MKDKYYYVLKECLSSRQEWIKNVEIFFRFRQLKEKAERETFKNNLIIYLIYKAINLPTITLNFLSKIRQYSEYNKTLAEIKVISLEMSKYNKPQITNRSENNAENKKDT